MLLFLFVAGYRLLQNGEEIAGSNSPLYEETVTDALKEQVKNSDEVPKQSASKAQSGETSNDLAIMAFIREEMSSVKTNQNETVYIYWSEKNGIFQKTLPERATSRKLAGNKGDDYVQDIYLYWSAQDNQFIAAPIEQLPEIKDRIKKGWGLSLSSKDQNVYVYICNSCTKVHKTILQVKADGGGRQTLQLSGDAIGHKEENRGATQETSVHSNEDLVGVSGSELVRKYGEPSQIQKLGVGAYQYDYSDKLGMVFIIGGEKVQYWIVSGKSKFRTVDQIGIGSSISELKELYGAWEKEEIVAKWFAGSEQNVLYHHQEFHKYKLNYPDKGYIFILGSEKKVEMFYAGDIACLLGSE